MISGQMTLSFADYWRALFGTSRTMQICLIAFAVAVVIFALNVFQSFASDEDDDIFGSWGVMALGIAAAVGIMGWSFWRLSPQQRQIIYEIDGERIVMRDAAGNAVIFPWSEVKSCRERATGFAFIMRIGGRWVGKRAFDEASLQSLRGLIRAQLGPRARLSA